jgi:predicted alpha-1,6-mannanase (GH76 family)
MIRLIALLAVLLALPGTSLHMQEETSPMERASRGVTVMMSWYNQESGLFDTTNWWNAANALYTVIDFMARSGTDSYLSAVANTFARHQVGGFLNEFYDDEGWWGLTWVHAYDLTGEMRYLEMARAIFDDMTTGWDEVCGGGIWWTKERGYKNAIPNSLFLTLAARLARRTDEPIYRDWAERTWAWFQASGMINSLGLVNDGLANCQNNGDITWTYNQGVLIGGLVELYHLTGDEMLIAQARTIADASIRLLVDENGVLREPCELSYNCGADGPQFKGIFMRHLRALYDVTAEPRYMAFITHNAEAIWRNRSVDDQFGLRWGARFDRADAARHSSALDAILVAIPVS